jgi:hypothetical protein
MAAVRAVLIAIIILTLAMSPLAVPLASGSSPGDMTAYAAFVGGGRPADQAQTPALQDDDDDNGSNDNDDDDDDNGGNDDDDDGNGNDNGGDDDDDGNGNDNGGDDDDDDGNGNDNQGDDDDDGNGNGNGNDNGGDDNGNGNDNVVVVVRQPRDSVARPTKCFDTREVGVVQLGTGSFDVTVTIMPHSSFNQTTRLTLRALNPSSVPPLPGGLVDSVVFQLDAQAGCDGVSIGTLPNLVNMGIVYNVPNVVDKSRLQIVRLEGGSWVNVDTVPDPVPGNPYVSTTIGVAGTYALIQR